MPTRRSLTLALVAGAALRRVTRPAEAATAEDAAPSADQPNPLYFGERVIQAAGFPTLIRFLKGQPDQPMIVFVPGTSFLARIAYGHPSGRADDFLSNWVVRAGYSFLGASYPLDNPVYERVYPEFGVTDWGRQIAAAARRVIDENKLGRRIVVVGWSMGGKSAVTLARAAKAAGLDLMLFVALDALPPGLNLFPGNAEGFRLASNGMVAQAETLMPWFMKMLAVQNRMNGRTIVSAEVLRTQMTGNPPLNVQGEAQRFRNGRIAVMPAAAAADSGADDYDTGPPIGLIIGDSPLDYPNVLLSRSNWGLRIGQYLYRTYVYPERDRLPLIPDANWRDLQATLRSAPDRLTMQLPGTHFLFVGEIGARAAVAAIAALVRRSDEVQSEIRAALG